MTQEIFYDLRPEQVAGKEVVLVQGEGQASISAPTRSRSFDYVRDFQHCANKVYLDMVREVNGMIENIELILLEWRAIVSLSQLV
jgi:hypothetical protein